MKENRYFRNKVVIITGASSGIGKIAAERLAALQARVALASRNRVNLNAIAGPLRSSDCSVLAIQTDVSREKDVKHMVASVLDQWGEIDILIANAGQYVRRSLADMDVASFHQSLAVNFYGALYAVNSVLPTMIERRSGHIVLVNSLDAKKGITGDGPYVAAKSALDGLGDVLRQEMKEYGIQVTSVYPGRVDTPMIEHLRVPWISAKISPQKVVRAMLKGIRKKKAIVVVPKMYYTLGALNNLAPRLLDWFYKMFHLEGSAKNE
ncbi:SDR family NAD(P)-dependent oxidoreductase [candidate division KSB1 bacterium]|nr:SDR family NAD(P)-dependent oxidoreductase [candidate division KSB1 bacterium]